MSDTKFETHEHDVLVIGAGGAGLRAAIEASAAGVSVGLVCKSLLGKAHTVMAEGGVAAALGTDGTIRETGLVHGDAKPIETLFVSPAAARTLSSYLRDAVVSGTGRLLKDHPARIAGKTGTAEIDEAGSHAWFVGFAPAGAATKRVAFAVILENAGYGGVSAASVAGQVVTAAASLGFVK